MSFIGKLEQLNLSLILQGIETYGKTGLLVIQHEAQWVELYFRGGRLMCLGPVRPNAALADRLLQAGVITPLALQEAQQAMGVEQPGETRIALMLMDLGHVTHEGLQAWSTQEASEVIQVLLTWQRGDIYFEDGIQPPPDRLLIALSPAALLSPMRSASFSFQPQPGHIEATPSMQEPAQAMQGSVGAAGAKDMLAGQEPHLSAKDASAPASINVAELIAETPASPPSFSLLEIRTPVLNTSSSFDGAAPSPLSPPQPVTTPVQPMRIDTSFMKPGMVLLPVDLSSLREQNPQLQITPDQWRLLTRVDGRNTLMTICQELAMAPAMVCQIAGELMALGVVRVALPTKQTAVNELSPVSREYITAGLGNGYVTPGYAATPAQPWSAVAPITDALPPTFGSSASFETKSQWGNGGNGATFVPGKGWVATPQPLQPVQPSGPLYSIQGVYAYVDQRR